MISIIIIYFSILFLLFPILLYKKRNILSYIFNKNELLNQHINCNNITLRFDCTNISFINRKFKILSSYVSFNKMNYYLYNSRIISNFSLYNIPNKLKIEKKLVYYRYKYLLIHFSRIYVYQNGVLQYKCITFNLKGGCGCDVNNNNIGNVNYYKNVFSITQTWANAVFHSIIECLTKLGLYINEIINQQSIYIHLYNSAATQYLLFLGVSRKRIINGNIYAMSLIITPKSSCGSYSNIHNLYYLRNKLRKLSKIDKSIQIVLIRRIYSRKIYNHDYLYNELLKHYNTKVYNYNDSINRISTLFSSAQVIIAPHGAGLSNIIFCKINTLIIEFLNKNRLNLCYNGLAKALGIKYIGVLTHLSKNNSFYVNVSFVISLLNKYTF